MVGEGWATRASPTTRGVYRRNAPIHGLVTIPALPSPAAHPWTPAACFYQSQPCTVPLSAQLNMKPHTIAPSYSSRRCPQAGRQTCLLLRALLRSKVFAPLKAQFLCLFLPSGFHRAFTFSALKLSSSRHVEPGTPDGTLHVPTTIERIVVLGLPPAKKGYKAVVQSGTGASREVPVEAGPANMVAGPQYDNAFVVRKPDLPVAEDWTLQLVAL